MPLQLLVTPSRLLAALVLCLSLALAPLASAEALKSDQITGFLASLAELETLSGRYDESELEGEADFDPMAEGDGMNIMASAVGRMKGHPMYKDVTSIVRKHGFDNPEQWGQIGDRVLKAYTAASVEAENPGARQEMEQALQGLENNPNMSAEQKAMMKKSMGGAINRARSLMDAPAEDIEAIRPHMADIERSMTQSAR